MWDNFELKCLNWYNNDKKIAPMLDIIFVHVVIWGFKRFKLHNAWKRHILNNLIHFL